jgi:chromosome segregation ATPase
LTQELKKRAPDDDDAWLEEALLLAASELGAFRASAQVERERMQHAHDATRARVHALEEQQRQAELRHANELGDIRALLEAQLSQRAKAWQDFSKDLGQRMASLASAKLLHAREVEEAGVLRQQLHETRAQLQAAQGQRTELELRLAANEESFASAASELQRLRAEAIASRSERDILRTEHGASAARCVELQRQCQDWDHKYADSERAGAELQARFEQTSAQLVSAQARVASLEEEAQALATLRSALADSRESHTSLQAELGRARDDAAQALREAESAKQAAESARGAVVVAEELAKQAHGDMLAARRERDEVTQTLDARRKAELAMLQTERDQVRAELEEQATTRWAMLDMEKQRSAKLKTELDHSRAELEPLLTVRDRLQAELDASRAELEPLRAAQTRLQSELEPLRVAQTRLQSELEPLRAAQTRLQSELEPLRVALTQLQIELSVQREERDRLEAELESLQTAQTTSIEVRALQYDPVRTNARDHATVPMPIPDLAPANQPAPVPAPAAFTAPRVREGTAYSYSEVAEEQVFVPARTPGKGGGRGSL